MPRKRKPQIYTPRQIKVEDWDIPLIGLTSVPPEWEIVFGAMTEPHYDRPDLRFHQALGRLILADIIRRKWDNSIRFEKGIKTDIAPWGELGYRLLNLVIQTSPFIHEMPAKYAKRDSIDFYSSILILPSRYKICRSKRVFPSAVNLFFWVFCESEWAGNSFQLFPRSLLGTKTKLIQSIQSDNGKLNKLENPFSSPATLKLFEKAINLSKTRGTDESYREKVYNPFVKARMKLPTYLKSSDMKIKTFDDLVAIASSRK